MPAGRSALSPTSTGNLGMVDTPTVHKATKQQQADDEKTFPISCNICLVPVTPPAQNASPLGLPADQRIVDAGEGKVLMDQIRAVIGPSFPLAGSSPSRR
jgi:hypothetical protein